MRYRNTVVCIIEKMDIYNHYYKREYSILFNFNRSLIGKMTYLNLDCHRFSYVNSFLVWCKTPSKTVDQFGVLKRALPPNDSNGRIL
jgi:hypothetical protein